MSLSKPNGFTAVMSSRVEPRDSLEFFATPPWSARALIEHVIGRGKYPLKTMACWEPAAGEGHMAEVLREYFGMVHASDVHDYGHDYAVGSFVGEGLDVAQFPGFPRADFVITNPPFNLAVDFAERGLEQSRVGVALLLRSVWTEGRERYERLFRDRPPTTVAVFCERVPMTKGGWDPDASTATSYSWFVWERAEMGRPTQMVWIPPGQRQALERPTDRTRFAAPSKRDVPSQLFGHEAG